MRASLGAGDMRKDLISDLTPPVICNTYVYIYIYIYMYRERERYTHIQTYIHI